MVKAGCGLPLNGIQAAGSLSNPSRMLYSVNDLLTSGEQQALQLTESKDRHG
jgi:hypothetical protein